MPQVLTIGDETDITSGYERKVICYRSNDELTVEKISN
ncbi:hypothetical protein BH10BAC4_BH10BAC4_13300 [soil metagenome]